MMKYNENSMENTINISGAELEAGIGANKGKKHFKKQPNIHSVNGKGKKTFPFVTLCYAVIFTLLLMMLVSNYVALNEYTKDISDLEAKVDALEDREKELAGELDKKYDLVEIEKQAKEEYGMVDSSEVEKKYIEVGDDEKIEVYEVEEDGTVGTITNALFALADNLRDSWNTLMGNE